LKEKKKGPETRKPADPKRMTEAKHLFNSKKKELESQEAKLFMKFAESYPPADLRLDAALAVWNFLVFLKNNGYIIQDTKEMVKLKIEVGDVE